MGCTRYGRMLLGAEAVLGCLAGTAERAEAGFTFTIGQVARTSSSQAKGCLDALYS